MRPLSWLVFLLVVTLVLGEKKAEKEQDEGGKLEKILESKSGKI